MSPVGVLNLGKLSWWLYKGKVYLTQGHPKPRNNGSVSWNFLAGRGYSELSNKVFLLFLG